MNIHLPQTEEARAEAGASSGTSGTLKYTQVSSYMAYGWVISLNHYINISSMRIQERPAIIIQQLSSTQDNLPQFYRSWTQRFLGCTFKNMNHENRHSTIIDKSSNQMWSMGLSIFHRKLLNKLHEKLPQFTVPYCTPVTYHLNMLKPHVDVFNKVQAWKHHHPIYLFQKAQHRNCPHLMVYSAMLGK